MEGPVGGRRLAGADVLALAEMFSLLTMTMLNKNFNASTPISSLDSEVEHIMGDHSGEL